MIPSGKRTIIPFKPARVVEDAVLQTDHNCQKLGNLNLSAPIAPSTWRIWVDLKMAKIEECHEQALWGKNFISSGNSFSQHYIQYFGRLEASQNNIVHLNMKKSIFIEGIFVEYVGSSCS